MTLGVQLGSRSKGKGRGGVLIHMSCFTPSGLKEYSLDELLEVSRKVTFAASLILEHR